MIEYLFILLLFLVIIILSKLLAIKMYSKYFSTGFVGDSSFHIVLCRELNKNHNIKSVSQYMPNDIEMTYPTLFHRLCSKFPSEVIYDYQWLPNLIVQLFSYISSIGICFYILFRQNTFSLEVFILFSIILTFIPSNFIFERDDANYIKLSERYLARVTSSLGYSTSALGMLINDPFLLIISVFFWTTSILTSKFSRQIFLFELPLLSLFLMDYRGLIIFFISSTISFLFGGKRLWHSMLHMFNHLNTYRLKTRYAKIVSTYIQSLSSLQNQLRKSNTLREKLQILTLINPARFFFHYPEIICTMIFSLAYSHPFFSTFKLAIIFTIPIFIYIATSTKYFNYLGEGYRYLEYSFYHLPAFICILWIPIYPKIIYFVFLIFVINIFIISNIYLPLFKTQQSTKDILSIFLNKLNLENNVVIYPITARTGFDIAARRSEWKVCLWQPGNFESTADVIEEYPFLKRDWWPLFKKHKVTHVICQKVALSYIDWKYPFEQLNLIYEDSNFAAYSVPLERC